LLFETDEHKPIGVDANRLGTLLFRAGVPLWRSTPAKVPSRRKPTPTPVSPRAHSARGVGSVLAMNYSVLVEAARQKFVAAFYGELADGCTVGQAVDAGRFNLALRRSAPHAHPPRCAGRIASEEKVRLRRTGSCLRSTSNRLIHCLPPVPRVPAGPRREPAKGLPLL